MVVFYPTMKARTLLFFLLLAFGVLPLTFEGKFETTKSEPFVFARYYDSLAMPDSALFWLSKMNTASLSAEAKGRYHLLMASQLRQLNRIDEAWNYYDSLMNLIAKAGSMLIFAGETEFLKGQLLVDKGDYVNAITSFDSAERILTTPFLADTGLIVRLRNFQGVARYYLEDLSIAADNLKQGVSTASLSKHTNPRDYADVLQNLAIVYADMSMFDSAYAYIVKARAMKEKALKQNDPVLISFYVNYGRILQLTGRMEESLQTFNTADNLLKDLDGIDYIKGVLHNNMGNSYQLTADYERAVQYFQSAYSYLLQSRGPTHPRVASVLNNLAFMYNRMGRPDSALSILNRLQNNQLTPATRIRWFRNLAITYRSLRRYDKAIENISKSISTAEQHVGKQHFEYAYSLFEKAIIGIAMNDFHLALSSIKDAEQAYANIFPATDEEYINILRIRAFANSRLLRYNEAEQIFMQIDSLLSMIERGESASDQGMSRYQSFIKGAVLLDRARMHQEWYAITGDSDKLAKSAEMYGRGLFIYEHYIQFASDESKLLLSDDMRGTYEDALRAAWDLYALKGGQDNLNLAFSFANRTKSSVLLSSIRKLQAFEAAGVPLQTTDTERRLRLEIHALTRAVSEERLKPIPNYNRIAFLNAKRIALTRSYDSLMKQIETQNPDYYALRFAPPTLRLQELQSNLSPDQALIDYFFDSNNLYFFAVRRDSILLIRNPKPDSLEIEVDSLRHIILGSLMTHSLADYHSFIKISLNLFNVLIEPIEGFIKNHRLIIVPDGVLGYLPFDLLINPTKLTSEHRQNLNYSMLPLLLYDLPVSYLSSSSLTQAFNNASGQKTGQLLAMAPDYVYKTLNHSNNKNKYTPLPFAIKEAESVRKIWGGLVLAGDKATKRAFLDRAPKYGLLHLAMHTLLDDENPLYSKLIFQPEDTASNEMYSFELYALRLKAALVVLSACNSGVGTLRSAEGVMSLSRAFIYAGTPSVVMTGWEVNDQSGAILMELFYQKLASGLTKDRALQQAKIAWLSESNQFKSHPFFWAAYQLHGDTKPLKKGIGYQSLISILLGLLLISVVVVIVRRRGIATFASKL
jgi:CHAT domain-containing protein/Flp pilus assembly protein TadD